VGSNPTLSASLFVFWALTPINTAIDTNFPAAMSENCHSRRLPTYDRLHFRRIFWSVGRMRMHMSAGKAVGSNLTKYVKVAERKWRHCPVLRGSTGRVKPDHVLVGERVEVHPEGYYSIEWREEGKRRRVSVGRNAAQAQQAQEQKNLMLQAKARGLSLEEKSPDVTLADACADFLDEVRQQRTRKTLAQYSVALEYFQASSPAASLQSIERGDPMRYMAFLAEEKHLAPRSIWTKIVIVVQMLKSYGIVDLLSPRFQFEPLPPHGIVRHFRRQNLQRHISSQSRIARPVHFPHAACAERGDDLVRSKLVTGTKRHFRNLSLYSNSGQNWAIPSDHRRSNARAQICLDCL
jgi:hypothetical protein